MRGSVHDASPRGGSRPPILGVSSINVRSVASGVPDALPGARLRRRAPLRRHALAVRERRAPAGRAASRRLLRALPLRRVRGIARALLTHDELDHAPVVGAPSGEKFWEPLTGRIAGDSGEELREAAASHVRRGDWPWLFWCAEERCRKPLFPSEIRFAARRDDRVGIAVVCSACERASLNVVTPWHLDVPFFHDRAVEAMRPPAAQPRQRTLRRRARRRAAARARAALAGYAAPARRRCAAASGVRASTTRSLPRRLASYSASSADAKSEAESPPSAERRDARRARDAQPVGEAQLAQPGDHARGRRRGRALVAAHEQHELLAAEARGDVGVARGAPQRPRRPVAAPRCRAAWPWRSLTCLKSSRSSITSETSPP